MSHKARSVADRLRRRQIACRVDVDSPEGPISGFGCNLSAGGAFVALFGPWLPERGSEVEMRFALAPGRWLVAQARICWIRPLDPAEPQLVPGVGVEFVDLSEELKAAVDQWAQGLPVSLGLRLPDHA